MFISYEETPNHLLIYIDGDRRVLRFFRQWLRGDGVVCKVDMFQMREGENSWIHRGDLYVCQETMVLLLN